MREEELKVRLWHKRFLSTSSDKVFVKIWEQVKNMVTAPYSQFPECPPGHWDSIKMCAVYEGLLKYSGSHKVKSQKMVEMPGAAKAVTRTVVEEQTIQLPNGEEKTVIVEKTLQEQIKVKPKIKVVKIERESNMTLLSYLRMQMELAIKNECRALRALRKNKSLDDTYEDDDHSKADLICFNEMKDRWKLYQHNPEADEEAIEQLKQAIINRLTEKGETKVLRAFKLKLKHPSITNRRIAKVLGVSKTYASSYFKRLQDVMAEVIKETDTRIM
jgi:uncharacterized pyridoxamine 5'-phosphate oxidase family protein